MKNNNDEDKVLVVNGLANIQFDSQSLGGIPKLFQNIVNCEEELSEALFIKEDLNEAKKKEIALHDAVQKLKDKNITISFF